MKKETYTSADADYLHMLARGISEQTNWNVIPVFEKENNGWYLQDANHQERYSVGGFGRGNTTKEFKNKLYGFWCAVGLIHNGVMKIAD